MLQQEQPQRKVTDEMRLLDFAEALYQLGFVNIHRPTSYPVHCYYFYSHKMSVRGFKRGDYQG